jgi:hypothetical protein
METATPLIDTVRELLGHDKITMVPRCQAKGDSIEAARHVFPHVFFEAKKTTRLVKCLGFYRYAWDDDASRFNDKPEDDWSADGSDAFQGLGIAWLTMSIGGRRLGRTTPVLPAMKQHESSYNNNVMTRGMSSYNNSVLIRGMTG